MGSEQAGPEEAAGNRRELVLPIAVFDITSDIIKDRISFIYQRDCIDLMKCLRNEEGPLP